mmetsp:Transcript_3248/g.7664  ORF Transcript_3248/g.7664 Transcript_3248/m.7664 type:complete len:272 (+) Transcript_3248:560-1375(+)
MEQRRGNPEEAQHEHHSAPRRALCERREDRNGDHASEASPEDQCLSARNLFLLFAGSQCRTLELCIAIHLDVLVTQGPDDAQDAGKDQVSQQRHGGHLATNVEHSGRDVTNRRPGSTGIGRDHDDATETHPEIHILHNLLHQGYHDDDHRQIIQHRGQHEGQEANDDEQITRFRGLDGLRDDVEPLVSIHDLNDCQCPEQEEHHLGNVLQGVLDVPGELLWCQIEPSAHEDPDEDTKHQCGSGLVDLCLFLEHDHGVSSEESGHNREIHRG